MASPITDAHMTEHPMTTEAVSVPPDSFCIQEGQFPSLKSRFSMGPARSKGFYFSTVGFNGSLGRFPNQQQFRAGWDIVHFPPILSQT